MKNILATSLLALLAANFIAPAWAGPFSVNPVRIYMTPKDKAVAVTIINEGDEELVMQADLYTWNQKPDGEDDLVLTEDLLLSPPIIKLPGKAKQVVRLARLRPMSQEQQQTYRLVVREIPEAKPSTGTLQLQIAVAFSLPIFITPPKAKYELACTATRSATGTVSANCENTGNAYAQLIDLELAAPGGARLAGRDSGGYILPAIKRGFDLKPSGGVIPAGPAKLTVRMDDGAKRTFDVTLE